MKDTGAKNEILMLVKFKCKIPKTNFIKIMQPGLISETKHSDGRTHKRPFPIMYS
jgi:hypothetical protein